MTATIRTAAPMGRSRRVSSDSAWPIRRADGLTPAQTRQHYRPLVEPRQPMPESKPRWWPFNRKDR